MPARDGWLRGLVELIVCLAIGALLVRTWAAEPRIVVGGSMAEALLGSHREIVCAECGFRFSCEADGEISPERKAICPNCGASNNDLSAAMVLAGDRLLVDKSAFAWRSPRRWEAVALADPRHAGERIIKRVVGLPGEAIEIRAGDVFVDGRIVRKSLEQQRALAVLVHDAYYAAPGLPPRWRSHGPIAGWRARRSGYSFVPNSGGSPADDSKRVQWLSYEHWKRKSSDRRRTEPARIMDDSGYNQLRPRLDGGHPVNDLLLAFRVRVKGHGPLHLHAAHGYNRFLIEINTGTGAVKASTNGRRVASGRIKIPRGQTAKVELSTIDRRLLLVWNDRLVFRPFAFEPTQQRPAPTFNGSLAIGAANLRVDVSGLRVYRDVYYTRPATPGPLWAVGQPYRLGSEEYFVLGDNSPHSDDSRSWRQGPALKRSQVLGKASLVYLPMRSVRWQDRQFQVPALSDIRYIR